MRAVAARWWCERGRRALVGVSSPSEERAGARRGAGTLKIAKSNKKNRRACNTDEVTNPAAEVRTLQPGDVPSRRSPTPVGAPPLLTFLYFANFSAPIWGGATRLGWGLMAASEAHRRLPGTSARRRSVYHAKTCAKRDNRDRTSEPCSLAQRLRPAVAERAEEAAAAARRARGRRLEHECCKHAFALD